MRVVLLYPPPWKIPEPGAAADLQDGPPPGFRPTDLDPDFHQTPYGLFSLAAQALRAGHQVKVLNLSAYTWERTEAILRDLKADVYGLSCWTANRRGVQLVTDKLRQLYPTSHIIVGGPHATPLAREVMEHYTAIDTVSLGESEEQFLELLSRLQRGQPTIGIAGTWYRFEGQVTQAPPRAAIPELDVLASPHDYFDTHIVMTSRGCPWQCTFCGAETTWGRGFRGQSIDYVLDAIENALKRVPVKMLQIKDDTFTANKKRAMDICKGIRARGLNFIWSCDTRVDVLTEELLREMRLAGCQRLSLGVESGSPAILKAINKKITAAKIMEAGNMAKKYGIHVRFYMMLGNRGETRETFYETLDFLKRAQPHQYLFSCLSIYPGTVDFHDAEEAGWLNREVYFTDKFQELKVPFDATPEDARLMSDWFALNRGIQNAYRDGVPECLAILEQLGDHHAAHMDLGGAYFQAQRYDLAEKHILKALELGYPLPGLAHNYLASIAAKRFDLKATQEHLRLALRLDPYHYPVARNAETLRRWLVDAGPLQGRPLDLEAYHEFQLFERTAQPTLPGPLAVDFATWADDVPLPAPIPSPVRHLPVISGESV
jgi:anaerobic magnesium-protoporphyrin IX monomethyl ester cyclase